MTRNTNEDIWADYADHQDDATNANEVVNGIVAVLEYGDYEQGYTAAEVAAFIDWAAANHAMLTARYRGWS